MRCLNSVKSSLHSAVRRAFVACIALGLGISGALANSDESGRAPEVCDSIKVPEGNEVAFHAYAIGAQIYRWSGSAWTFVAPAAVLYADPGYQGEVGTHYAGPTWESNSGSQIVG